MIKEKVIDTRKYRQVTQYPRPGIRYVKDKQGNLYEPKSLVENVFSVVFYYLKKCASMEF